MKKYFIASFVSLLAFMFLGAGIAPRAAAFDPFKQACTLESQSAVCSADGTQNPIYGPHGVINKIANIFALVTGISAVVLIIIGGFEYVRSTGDSAKVNKAKNTIIYAIVGLVVVVVARSVVGLAVSKL